MHRAMRTAASDFDNPNINVVAAMPRIPTRTTGRRPMTSKEKVSARRAGRGGSRQTGEASPVIYGGKLDDCKGALLKKVKRMCQMNRWECNVRQARCKSLCEKGRR